MESLVLEDEAPAEEAASLPASAQPVTGHSYKWPGQMENHLINKKLNIYQMSSSIIWLLFLLLPEADREAAGRAQES